MKTVIILIVIIAVLVILVLRKKKNVEQIRPFQFVDLNSNLESRNYLPTVPKNFLSDTEIKFKGIDLKEHPSEYSELSNKLCSRVYANSKYWEKNLSHADFLNRLTKEQRILFALVNFESQTNNGGVYQFLFNQPELSFVVWDAMIITKMDTLAKDYERVLQELFKNKGKINELRIKFQDNKLDWSSRWNAFAGGYDELKSGEVIEGYFYEDNFVRNFRSKMIEFVKFNPKNLFIEED